MSETSNHYQVLWSELKETFKLNVDYARLTMAEKLTVLLTTITFVSIAFVLVGIIVFFLSLAIVRCIAVGVGMIWAYIIVSAFYLLMLAFLLAFRKQLIINPISRFVSRLFFNP